MTPHHERITRRQIILAAAAGTSGFLAGTILRADEQQTDPHDPVPAAAPKIQGPFPILSTPFTTSGTADFDTLARKARFVDWCGSPGNDRAAVGR